MIIFYFKKNRAFAQTPDDTLNTDKSNKKKSEPPIIT
jgi:hypothetical protein